MADEKVAKNRFQNQQYLFENWYYILERLETGQRQNVSLQTREANERYRRGVTKPFYYYKMKETVEAFVNILSLKEGIQEFLNIKNSQLSALIPKIRLFKVVNYGSGKEREIEFSINDNTDITTITSDRIGRGAGVGLESFTWDFQGSQPAEVEKYITTEMVLVFQTIEEIFRIRGGEGKEYSFADLTFYNQKASQNKMPSGRCGLEQSTNTSTRNGPFYIKAEVGWSLPNINDEFFAGFDGNIETVRKLKKAIEDSTYVFLLQPTVHETSINESGVARLTLKFVAAIEDVINVSPHANILGTGKHDNERMRNLQERNRLIRWAAANQNIVELEEEKFNDYVIDYINQNPNDFKRVSEMKRNRDKIREDYNVYGILESFNKISDEVDNDKWSEIQHKVISGGDIGQQSYGTLLDRIIDSGNLYFMEIDEDSIGEWRKSLSKGQGFEISREKGLMVVRSLKDLLPKQYGEVTQALSERDFVAAEENISIGSFSRRHKIIFMFYGDLLDAAISIADSRDKENILDKIGFILGPIFIESPLTGKIERRSIADIPISVEYFSEWFNKTVIKPAKTEFTLHEFIHTSASGLIEGVLRSVEARDKSNRKQRIGINVIHTPVNESGVEIFQEIVGSKDPTWTISLEQYKKAISVTKYNRIRPFVVLYFTETPNVENRIPNFKEDAKNGIYHLYPGSDRGIVLSIDYEKTDIPGFYESQLLNVTTGKGTESEVIDVFNCKLELIGNTIFKNGDLVYIEPASLLGSFGEYRSAARRLGLLGYYRIVKVNSKIDIGNYTTEIECIAEIAQRGKCEEESKSAPLKTANVLTEYQDKLISEK